VKAVEERAGKGAIMWGRKIVGVLEGVKGDEGKDEGVVLQFEDGDSMTAPFVIGAEGIYSTLRTHVAPGAGLPEYHGVVRVAGTVSARDVPSLLGNPAGNDPTFDYPFIFTGRDGNFGIFPADHAGDEVAFSTYFEIGENGRGRAGWKTLGEDKARLAAMVRERVCSEEAAGEWPGLVREICEKVQESRMLAWP